MGGCKPPCPAKRAATERALRERRILRKDRPRRVLAVGDMHVPYHDEAAVGAALDFARWWKPDILIVHGDAFDFYELSAYEKNPARTETLQDELDEGASVLSKFASATARNAIKVFLEGNHEDRLRRYLWKKAPELSTLRTLQFEEMTGLRKLGFETHSYGEPYSVGNLHFVHGDIVRKNAGFTAKAMLLKYGVSIAHGHTHRLAEITERKFGGVLRGYELGCLADLKPEYVKGTPDWDHGFGAGVVLASGEFHFKTVPVVNGRAFFGREVFGA